ncbi:MAG: uroporphyrinogen-III C-methyltransferase, partial [Gammaproteobacteria bacterium]|nr:uroporphyrinogen-III C-methyltransferase [Gammaproteobacteria bacterium]
RRAGADVVVIAPHLGPALRADVDRGRVRHVARLFADSDVDNNALIIAATDDPDVNRRIGELARSRNVPVNVASDAALGSFILPPVIDRSPLQIAVSAGGASPALSRDLRGRLENFIPAAYGQLAGLLRSFRPALRRRFPDQAQRRRFSEQVLHGPVAEAVFAGRVIDAREMLSRMLAADASPPRLAGEVYLVGAGPGDPDLLTFRALRLIHQADVVVYDRLVSQPILELVRADAERLYAGKYPRGPAIAQEAINQLLIRLAKQGKRVLRLKGGDPFIFGRGGEEIATLVEEGIPFQVVPGITAASGSAAYARIPLTHRDYAQACVFVTGHLKNGTVDLNWQMLAHERQTLVFYMGLLGVEVICAQLVAHGLSASTPAALIAQGTTPRQRVLIGDLATLPGLVADNAVQAPTLIIVGQVVRLHDKLRWFEPTAATDSSPR